MQIASKSRTKRIDEMPTIAYASMLNGVEIKAIEHSIEDYVLCVSNAWHNRADLKAHRVKIYYGDRPYFIIRCTRVYLDECIRV